MNFHEEAKEIATDLVRAITIPRIKRAIGMQSEFFIKCKREERPWTAIYDLEHIRHLEPALIRIMLLVTNLGFSYAEAAAWLKISEHSVEIHCLEAWRELREQVSYNQKVEKKALLSTDDNVRIAA